MRDEACFFFFVFFSPSCWHQLQRYLKGTVFFIDHSVMESQAHLVHDVKLMLAFKPFSRMIGTKNFN